MTMIFSIRQNLCSLNSVFLFRCASIMYRWKGKIAVVTGASKGIGLAVARAFLQKGLIVIGLSRRKHEMEINMKNESQKGNFHAFKCDVSKEQEVIDVFKQIRKDFGVTQILVNNAGILAHGSLYETSRREWEDIFNVNIMGLLECSKQAILMMKEANLEGHIVNINSVQGHRVYNCGKYNVYAATKHAITAINQTLTNDLVGSNIRVTGINPSFTATDILPFLKGMKSLNQPVLDPEDVADSIIYIVGIPQHIQISELTIKPLGDTRS